MNEFGFYFASYNQDQADYIIKKKSLEVANFLKKEGDNLIENVLPHAFAITQFHIVYMYSRNITVLSKISREIVYSAPFTEADGVPLLGITLDQRMNRLMLNSKQSPIFVAYLKGEDTDAWRYYLRREQFQQALQTCKTGKQRAFACGYYADHLFKKEKFDKAADYYAQSDKTFEEVALKFLHRQRFNELIMYLERILRAIDVKKEELQPQRMLLYTWIVELKLNQINQLQAAAASTSNAEEAKRAEEDISLKQKKFHEFLKEHAGGLG
jgi:vacuolar protein sorting-associated protein 18